MSGAQSFKLDSHQRFAWEAFAISFFPLNHFFKGSFSPLTIFLKKQKGMKPLQEGGEQAARADTGVGKCILESVEKQSESERDCNNECEFETKLFFVCW